ncbi:MAG: inositol monophosphatase family protein, partial [Notoacmeibacter sp.]
ARPVLGVLYCPVSNAVYSAIAGQGAFKGDTQLKVAGSTHSLMRIAGPKPMIRALEEESQIKIKSVPYVPSLALRLAMVADGSLDATLVKPRSAFWDIAAADVIVSEAGCSLIDLDGSQVDYSKTSPKLGAMLAAQNQRLHSILTVVRSLSIG